MNIPLFLLASLGLGAAALCLMFAGFKLVEAFLPFAASESRLRRLQRRRERRIGRGHDRYFEELRSIDAAIAQTEDSMERQDPRVWYKRPIVLLVPLWAFLIGFVILDFFGPSLGLGTLPAWASACTDGWPILLGCSYLFDPYNQPFRTVRGRLAAGALYVALGIAFLSTDLSHSSF